MGVYKTLEGCSSFRLWARNVGSITSLNHLCRISWAHPKWTWEASWRC